MFNSLADVSFEAAGLDLEPLSDEQAYAEPAVNPVFSKEYQDDEKIIDTYQTIKDAGYITRDDVKRVAHLSDDYPHLRKLLQRNPVNSFSEEPSPINFDASMESFVKNTLEAIKRVIMKIVNFIIETVKKIYKFLTRSTERTRKIDTLEDSLKDMQDYLVNVDRALRSSAVGSEYAKHYIRLEDTERHNLNKKWNELSQWWSDNPAQGYSWVKTISDSLAVMVPAFTSDLSDFLEAITKYGDEKILEAAINAFERTPILSGNSSELTRLAIDAGWKANAPRHNNLTAFQAMALHVSGVIRSKGNDHKTDIPQSKFPALLNGFSIEKIGAELSSAVKKIEENGKALSAKFESFKPDKLQPGLETFYQNKLAPFMVALSSIVQGFNVLEMTLGQLVTARDNTALEVSKSLLSVIKGIDKFAGDNIRKLTLEEQVIRKRYRDRVIAHF